MGAVITAAHPPDTYHPLLPLVVVAAPASLPGDGGGAVLEPTSPPTTPCRWSWGSVGEASQPPTTQLPADGGGAVLEEPASPPSTHSLPMVMVGQCWRSQPATPPSPHSTDGGGGGLVLEEPASPPPDSHCRWCWWWGSVGGGSQPPLPHCGWWWGSVGGSSWPSLLMVLAQCCSSKVRLPAYGEGLVKVGRVIHIRLGADVVWG